MFAGGGYILRDYLAVYKRKGVIVQVWGMLASVCIPIVSIVVPFLVYNQYYILRILKGNPNKVLQWRR